MNVPFPSKIRVNPSNPCSYVWDVAVDVVFARSQTPVASS